MWTEAPWFAKGPISLPDMYSNSSHNLDDSETSPVGLPFFYFPAQIQMKASGLRTAGIRRSTQAERTWMTKWVLSYQSWTATKHVRLEQQHNRARAGHCFQCKDQGESRQLAKTQVRRCRSLLAELIISLSVWLTEVISTDLHFPSVWLKASCVKAVQIKTACHATLSSTLLHSNSPSYRVSSALPLLPWMFICC